MSVHPNALKSHCKRGHPLSGDNLYLKPSGIRQCRTCKRESGRIQSERRREWRRTGITPERRREIRRGEVPAERLIAPIKNFVDPVEELCHFNSGQGQSRLGGFTQLHYLTGVPVQTLQRIARGERDWCKVDVADKILTGLDLTHLWHYPPEDGGFADVWAKEWPEAA